LETEAHLLSIVNSSFFLLQSTPAIVVATVIAIGLLFALASVTAAEIALFSLSPSVKGKFEENKTERSGKLLKLVSNPERLMATFVVANVFFKIGFIIVSFFLTASLLHPETISWMLLLLTGSAGFMILLIVCEFVPKMYASTKPEVYLLGMTHWIGLLQKLLGPVSFLFYKTISSFNKKYNNRSSEISVSDLSDAIELGSDSFSEEEDILKGIVKFGNTDVSEILRPRIDVVSIDYKMTLRQVLAVVIESGYSRIPVYVGTFDNVKGILYVKDLLPHINEKDNFRWQTLIRAPYFVPETKRVKELLTEFQSNKIHMAIIVDEYGGSLGIVTLEDILEEIVGEITDESDEEEKNYTKINDNTYIFDGKTLLNDFHKIMQTEVSIFDDIKGDADTLAGLILEIKGIIPTKNEQIKYDDFTFKIEAVDSRRIKQIRVTVDK
jgi:putative hemolysin